MKQGTPAAQGVVFSAIPERSDAENAGLPANSPTGARGIAPGTGKRPFQKRSAQ